MLTEIITIGDELLLGQTIDTNSAWLGSKLSEIGVEIVRKSAVKDSENDILIALEEAFNRSNLILMTGGLGPTKDDITKQTLCKFFGVGLRRDNEVLEQLEKYFSQRNRALLEINKMQADLPENCLTLRNEVGTAPGMLFQYHGKMLISMPGVPYEMKNIMEQGGFSAIKSHFNLPKIIHNTALTFNIPESLLSKKLEPIENSLPSHIKLAYLPQFNTIRLRLSGQGMDHEKLESEMQIWFSQICTICGEHLIERVDKTLPELVGEKLIQRNLSISLAESCTGGFISHQLTLNPGISKVFPGSVISYANEIKIKELGVDKDIINTYGAVSEPCARAMAEGVKNKFQSDYSISTTGIAGPTGGSLEKPIGTIYIGIATPKKTVVKPFMLHGSRDQFISRASNAALAELYLLLGVE